MPSLNCWVTSYVYAMSLKPVSTRSKDVNLYSNSVPTTPHSSNALDRRARICVRPALPLGAQMPSKPGIVLPSSVIFAVRSASTSRHCGFLPIPYSSATPAAMALRASDASSPNLVGCALLTAFSVKVLFSSVSAKLMARFTGAIT